MKKRLDLDVLRIIAIIFVILNHTAANIYISTDLYNNGDNPIVYFIYLFLASLARVAVPIFFMISGALLIPKKETIAQVLKKRVLKYVLIIIGFSVFQYIYHILIDVSAFSLDSIIHYATQMYTSSVIVPYWFLYAYLGFLVMLPFIRVLVEHMTEKHFHYLILLHLIFFSALQIFEYFMELNRINVSIPLACETSLFYCILGYYLNSKDQHTKKQMVWHFVVSIVCVVVTVVMTYWQIGNNGVFTDGSTYRFSSALIIIPASFIFLFCKQTLQNGVKNESVNKALHMIAGTTFGLYLLEGVFEQFTFDVYFISKKFLPSILSWWVWIFVVVAIAVVVILGYQTAAKLIKTLYKRIAIKDK